MPNSGDLRAAVVGCGLIAGAHISALKKSRGVKVVAVCDLDESLARNTAAKYGVPRSYTGIADLLSEVRPDVVHITTPPRTHLSLSLQAMSAGCHVLLEKPIALTVGEFDRMAAAAAESGVLLSTIHNVLHVPVVLKARRLMEKGLIGELVLMQITQSEDNRSALTTDPDHWCHRLPGGIFGEMLPHPLYLARSFFGDLKVMSVHSCKRTAPAWLANDEACILLEGGRGMVTITATVRGRGNIMLIEFIGTEGRLAAALPNGIVSVHKVAPGGSRRPMGFENLRTARRWLTGTSSVALKVLLGSYPSTHSTPICRFTEAVRGRGDVPVGLAEAREVTGLYEAVTSQIPAK